jgi:hypothetical protein
MQLGQKGSDSFMVVSWCLVNAGEEEGHPIKRQSIENYGPEKCGFYAKEAGCVCRSAKISQFKK